MFELHGFTLVTFLFVILGVLVHGYKQSITASRSQADVTFASYWVSHWHETGVAGVCSVVLWAGLPELSTMLPEEMVNSLGLGGDVGVLSSFTCGFVGNSLADLLGARARSVAGM